jgi:16S rRNA processing protein RimM
VSTDIPSSRAVTQEPAWPENAVEVGRVLGAWGIKGWIKVQSFAADSQALFSASRWFVRSPEEGAMPQRAAASSSFPAHLKVQEAREHGGMVVAQVDGVVDRNQAEALRGARLFLGRANFPAAKAGEYYWIDLIGLSVVNRQGEAMGQVLGLIDTGPHSVLRLTRPEGESTTEGAERLIPFVAAYVDDVDLAKRCITVDWGLDY